MTTHPAAPGPIKRGRGRPRVPGARCETKLLPDVLAQVEALVGVVGADRSAVLAALVELGLASGDVAERVARRMHADPVIRGSRRQLP